jgi:hypothetical protein
MHNDMTLTFWITTFTAEVHDLIQGAPNPVLHRRQLRME